MALDELGWLVLPVIISQDGELALCKAMEEHKSTESSYGLPVTAHAPPAICFLLNGATCSVQVCAPLVKTKDGTPHHEDPWVKTAIDTTWSLCKPPKRGRNIIQVQVEVVQIKEPLYDVKFHLLIRLFCKLLPGTTVSIFQLILLVAPVTISAAS